MGLNRPGVDLRIVVNGQNRDVADGATIVDLIGLLDLKPDRVAVEVNRTILKRVEWGDATLKEGDRVEIVHFVGGGGLPGRA